jgi:hypothetical protein
MNASWVLKQRAVDILFHFLRTSTEYWIGNCDFDFVMLSFSFLAPNSVQLNFEFYWVVHFNTYNCSEQAEHSVVRFPRSVYTDVLRFGSRSVRLNAEVCYRREGAEVTSRGKNPVFILLLVSICVRSCYCVFFFVFVFFVSGPAHILCLTVASGWNKERCTPEIEITVTVTAKSSILVNLLYILSTRVWLCFSQVWATCVLDISYRNVAPR